jgi:hypothetical protein
LNFWYENKPSGNPDREFVFFSVAAEANETDPAGKSFASLAASPPPMPMPTGDNSLKVSELPPAPVSSRRCCCRCCHCCRDGDESKSDYVINVGMVITRKKYLI